MSREKARKSGASERFRAGPRAVARRFAHFLDFAHGLKGALYCSSALEVRVQRGGCASRASPASHGPIV